MSPGAQPTVVTRSFVQFIVRRTVETTEKGVEKTTEKGVTTNQRDVKMSERCVLHVFGSHCPRSDSCI